MNSYIPNTYQNIYNAKMNLNNAEQSFLSNTPLISKNDFTNKKTTLHDNLGENLKTENLVDYTIHINSINRDLLSYPSPFTFTTTFGGLSHYEYQNLNKSGMLVSMKGTIEPNIERNLLNIKAITLNNVYLPRTNIIITEINADPEIPIIYKLSDHDDHAFNRKRFMIIKIKELNTPRILSTGNPIGNNCFVINFDKGRMEQIWFSNCCTMTFPNSLLKKIDKLTLQLCDDEGNEVKLLNTDGSYFDIRQKLKDEPTNESLLNLNKIVQMNYRFIFSIVENELNTLPMFNH